MPENEIASELRNAVEARREYNYVLERFADCMESFVEGYMHYNYNKENSESFYTAPAEDDYGYKRYILAKDLAEKVIQFVMEEHMD